MVESVIYIFDSITHELVDIINTKNGEYEWFTTQYKLYNLLIKSTQKLSKYRYINNIIPNEYNYVKDNKCIVFVNEKYLYTIKKPDDMLVLTFLMYITHHLFDKNATIFLDFNHSPYELEYHIKKLISGVSDINDSIINVNDKPKEYFNELVERIMQKEVSELNANVKSSLNMSIEDANKLLNEYFNTDNSGKTKEMKNCDCSNNQNKVFYIDMTKHNNLSIEEQKEIIGKIIENNININKCPKMNNSEIKNTHCSSVKELPLLNDKTQYYIAVKERILSEVLNNRQVKFDSNGNNLTMSEIVKECELYYQWIIDL